MYRGRKNVAGFSFQAENDRHRIGWQGINIISQPGLTRLTSETERPNLPFQLQVYVKDAPSQITLTKKTPISNEQQVHTNQTQQIYQNNENEAEKRVIALMTMPGRMNEEPRQVPMQCSVPLKLNGVPSAVVPVNVENLSSLMQVVPDTDMPRIQQFKLPIQVSFKTEN